MVRERRAAPVREDDVIVPARQQLKRVENRGASRQSHGVGYSQPTHKQLPGSLPLCDIPVSRIAGAELVKARATRCECCTADSTQLTQRSTHTAGRTGKRGVGTWQSSHLAREGGARPPRRVRAHASIREHVVIAADVHVTFRRALKIAANQRSQSKHSCGRYFAFGQPCLSLNMSTTLQVSAEPPPQLPTTISAWFIP